MSNYSIVSRCTPNADTFKMNCGEGSVLRQKDKPILEEAIKRQADARKRLLDSRKVLSGG